MTDKSRKRPRRRRKQKQDLLDGLRKKVKQGPFREYEIVRSDEKVKMSVVLGDFIEPYVKHTDSEESYRKLITLAIMAWNASFLPETEQQEMIKKVFDEGIPTSTKELKKGLSDIVNQLIARKKAYFSQYKRHIIDFEVVDLGDQYHLSVASTPDNELTEE